MKRMLLIACSLVGCANLPETQRDRESKDKLIEKKFVHGDLGENSEFKVHKKLSGDHPGLFKDVDSTIVPGIFSVKTESNHGCDVYIDSDTAVAVNISKPIGWVYFSSLAVPVSSNTSAAIHSHIYKNMPNFLINIPGKVNTSIILVSAVDSENSINVEKILEKYDIGYKIMPTFLDFKNANFAKALACSDNATEAWKAARLGQDRIKPRKSCDFRARDSRDIMCMMGNSGLPAIIFSNGYRVDYPAVIEDVVKKLNAAHRDKNK